MYHKNYRMSIIIYYFSEIPRLLIKGCTDISVYRTAFNSPSAPVGAITDRPPSISSTAPVGMAIGHPPIHLSTKKGLL